MREGGKGGREMERGGGRRVREESERGERGKGGREMERGGRRRVREGK